MSALRNHTGLLLIGCASLAPKTCQESFVPVSLLRNAWQADVNTESAAAHLRVHSGLKYSWRLQLNAWEPSVSNHLPKQSANSETTKALRNGLGAVPGTVFGPFVSYASLRILRSLNCTCSVESVLTEI